MKSLLYNLFTVLVINLYFEMGMGILYCNHINVYPKNKCIYPKYNVRFKLFGYTKRNTVKGVPRELFFFKLYLLMSSGAVFVCGIYFFCKELKYFIKVMQGYCIAALFFSLLCIAIFERTVLLYQYKKLTIRNFFYLLFLSKRRRAKRYIGEAQIASTYKTRRRTYATVVCNNKEYKNVVVEAETPPLVLYKLLDVFWVERKEEKYFVYIEDIMRVMLEKKKDYKYYLRVSDLEIVPVFENYEQVIENSDNYILIPHLLKRAWDYEEGDLNYSITDRDMKAVERWCFSNKIRYCYRVMYQSMPLH